MAKKPKTPDNGTDKPVDNLTPAEEVRQEEPLASSEEKTEEEPAAPEKKPAKKKKESEMWKRAKGTTKMFLHVTKLFFLFTLGILIIGAIILSIVNAAKKSSESQYLIMGGTQVEVDGKYLHVIKGGNESSNVTLVFLHGDRITDDSVVLQPVFRKIEDQTAYFYVDRSGAGFSDAAVIHIHDQITTANR